MKNDEATMRTMQEEIAPTSKRKKTDRLCGRLIIWDVGVPADDIVMLAANYCHAKPDLSSANEPKPYTSSVQVVGTTPDALSSLKPIAQRFYQRYGFLPEYFSKKPLLN